MSDTTNVRALAPRQPMAPTAAAVGAATAPGVPVIGAEERALLLGDLSELNGEQRAKLVTNVCASLGLNPLTRPLQYITLNSKLVLYATKDCTDQLRAIHGISVRASKPEVSEDILFVTAHASTPTGRTDEDFGAVFVGGVRGEARANATMKCLTKAKRRVTLSICGLGMLDETEVESIPGARVMDDDTTAAGVARALEQPVKPERLALYERLVALRPRAGDETSPAWIGRILGEDEIRGIKSIEHKDELTAGYLRNLVERVEEIDRRQAAKQTVTRHQTTVVDGPPPLDMPAGAPHDGRAVPDAPPVPPSERPPLARQFMDKISEAADIRGDARRGETLDLIQDQARIAYDNQALTHDEMSNINTQVADIRAQLPF